MRGQAKDYDDWAQAGNIGWSLLSATLLQKICSKPP